MHKGQGAEEQYANQLGPEGDLDVNRGWKGGGRACGLWSQAEGEMDPRTG